MKKVESIMHGTVNCYESFGALEKAIARFNEKCIKANTLYVESWEHLNFNVNHLFYNHKISQGQLGKLHELLFVCRRP